MSLSIGTRRRGRTKAIVRQALLLPPVNAALRAIAGRLPITPAIARLAVAVDEVRVTVLDKEIVLTRPSRCSIAKELYWGRGRRVRPDGRVAFELFHVLARDADVVFDIGANTGIFALAAARANPLARVHAFEIVPGVFEQLLRNVIWNDLVERIECHLRGVGEPGFSMIVPDSQWAGPLPSSVSSLDRFDRGVRVPFDGLDEIGRRTLVAGDRLLIKIDVEGTEESIFGHGEQTVRAHRPDIVCEVLGDSRAGPVIERVLGGLGYRFYKFGDGELIPFESIVPDYRYYDWLFTTRPPESLPVTIRT